MGHLLAILTKIDKRLLRPTVALALIISVGSLTLVATEGWDLWKAFYFTLITITTVGHQDFELSVTGQYVSAAIIVSGIAVFSYMLGQSGRILFELEFRPERRMNAQIRQLQNHLIVCGLGRIGVTVCERLEDAGVPFVCVDTDAKGVERARERGWLAIEGDCTDDRALMRCRIDSAKGLAAVTSSDTANIVTTLTARDLAPELFILARAEAAESLRKINRAGASRVISPVREGAASIAESMLHPGAHDFLHPEDESEALTFAEIHIEPKSSIDGVTIEACQSRHPGLVMVAHRAKGETHLRPQGAEMIAGGDIVIAAGGRPAITAFKLDACATEAHRDNKRAA